MLDHGHHNLVLSTSTSRMERAMISELWCMIESFLMSESNEVEQFLGRMQEALPPLEQFDIKELPSLAQLHMSSSANMMKTLRLLAPDAFAPGSSEPDQAKFLQLQSSQLEMVGVLVELQIFHLLRASQLVSYTKQQLKKQHGSAAKASCCDSL